MGQRASRKLGFAAAAILALAQAPRALASQTLEVGALPLSIGQPFNYEDAFKGVGFTLGGALFFDNIPGGVAISFLTQGKGNAVNFTYRYYLLGEQQRPVSAPSTAQLDPKLRPLAINTAHYGFYFEAGPSLYRLDHNKIIAATSTSAGTSTPERTTGVGVLLNVGLEYPVFSFLYASLKVGVLNSLGGPANTVIFQAGLGYPLDLF